jgi:hypothetical protein
LACTTATVADTAAAMKLAKLIQLAAVTTERVNDAHRANTGCAGKRRRGAHPLVILEWTR